MSPRFRNKFLTICVAILASLLLVGGTIALDRVAPRGTLGWLIKTIPLAVAIPAVLIGYENLCDWYYRRFITGANQRFFANVLRSKTTVQCDHGHDLQVYGIAKQNSKRSPETRGMYQGAVKAFPAAVGNAGGSGATTMQVEQWIGQ